MFTFPTPHITATYRKRRQCDKTRNTWTHTLSQSSRSFRFHHQVVLPDFLLCIFLDLGHSHIRPEQSNQWNVSTIALAKDELHLQLVWGQMCVQILWIMHHEVLSKGLHNIAFSYLLSLTQSGVGTPGMLFRLREAEQKSCPISLHIL